MANNHLPPNLVSPTSVQDSLTVAGVAYVYKMGRAEEMVLRPENITVIRRQDPSTLAGIIENHRAVCTDTAAQLSDLESQIYVNVDAQVRTAELTARSQYADLLEAMLKDARQQLENACGQDTLFGPQSGFEAAWRRQNPGLSAAVKAVHDS